jgi:hypothetical protein
VAHRDSIKGENVRRLQKWSTSLIAGAAISFSIGCSLNAGVPSTGNLQDEAAIKRVVSEMTQGFNSHDAEAATRMYTTDADFVSVRGEVAKGREEIRKGAGGHSEHKGKECITRYSRHNYPVYSTRRCSCAR